jgi:predicted amidohydrolase YtcJ
LYRLDYDLGFVYIQSPTYPFTNKMKPRILIPIVFAAAILIYFAFIYPCATEASMLLINGQVYTVDDRQPIAEAIAIKDDKIVGVGSNYEIQSSFESTRVVDLKGKPVYPGFIDSHAHLESLGGLLLNLNVGGTNSVEEIQQLVSERVAHDGDGIWIRGRGWDQNRWPNMSFPTHEMLDAVAKDIPVYLTRIDGHAVWVNKKLLDIAGINKSTPDPEGGRIIRDKHGNPTGVFIDNAVDSLNARLPEPSKEERIEAIERAVKECVKVGLTEVHDMGQDVEGIEIYKELIQAQKFPIRIYVAIGGIGETWQHYLEHGPEIGAYGGRLTVRAVKLYADGALGSRGGALIEPYSDDPSNRGLTLTSASSIKSSAVLALERGFQVCIHAIGDRANHIVLDVYQDVLKSNRDKARNARFRIEHAQVVEQSDFPRFAQLDVLPMMQPTHCTSDMYWVEDRLGPVRVKGAYAWRSFLDQGSIVPGGSDFPVESPNPLWGFYAAITRQDHAGWPEGGWHPGQRMTREEVLKAFTLWGAYAAFEEKTKGSIVTGKLADLVVLSNDIMKVEPKEILETEVELTMVGGEVVFSSGTLTSVENRIQGIAQR